MLLRPIQTVRRLCSKKVKHSIFSTLVQNAAILWAFDYRVANARDAGPAGRYYLIQRILRAHNFLANSAIELYFLQVAGRWGVYRTAHHYALIETGLPVRRGMGLAINAMSCPAPHLWSVQTGANRRCLVRLLPRRRLTGYCSIVWVPHRLLARCYVLPITKAVGHLGGGNGNSRDGIFLSRTLVRWTRIEGLLRENCV